jgi:hypothetical protein
MTNDAMIVTVDRIDFLWPRSKKMHIYAVGITADNTGKVIVTEPPSSTTIKHVPNAGRPAKWDFAGDGYPIYQRFGGLADIVVAHLLIVRSRAKSRRAGEIVKEVAESSAANQAIEGASKALQNIKGALAATSALGLVLPIAEVVGEIIASRKDKVLQTISGSMFLDADRKAQKSFTQRVLAPDGNMEIETDVFLFDAATENEDVADTKEAETRLEAEGLLFQRSGG